MERCTELFDRSAWRNQFRKSSYEASFVFERLSVKPYPPERRKNPGGNTKTGGNILPIVRAPRFEAAALVFSIFDVTHRTRAPAEKPPPPVPVSADPACPERLSEVRKPDPLGLPLVFIQRQTSSALSPGQTACPRFPESAESPVHRWR